MQQLTEKEAREHLKRIKGWELVGNAIEKTCKFTNFKQAIEFINRVADLAERQNHHPDILLWSWNNVKLTLTTHAVKGLSQSDFNLASEIDKIKL